MDFFLLFFVLVSIVVFFIINVKMVLHYEEEDANNENWFSKGVIITCFTLAYMVIFLLPIDVRNSRNDSGLDMEFFWTMAFILVLFFTTLVIPV